MVELPRNPHETAAHGFQAQADSYDLARPRYPVEAINFIVALVHSGAKIADVGAGTGIMTTFLYEAGLDVSAIEPVDNMRMKLQDQLPTVHAIKATAWDTTLPDASQDAVIMAQAFHWFDDLNTLKEAHRILKPGGKLILIWNMESKQAKWVEALRSLYERYDEAAPQYRKGYWQQVFSEPTAAQLFRLPLTHQNFAYDMPCNKALVMPRIVSKSYIAVLPKDEQDKLATQVNAVLDNPSYGFTCDDQGNFIYPHDTDLYWCEKI
ncbi:S-adenosyl-L-methionine-dependent methyltransferase [Hesseltinella vesiculosa]|uniref:S-adenosyl-L-methionine-dependent methyltransferase n=1 Tax=Hesseltinella vesiculosa TaxID=101127 RepID=A0A1X2GV89_9FUNG|nr:S-adenosyl-L-methionine-dependent methyltransferase [Hesseltinella vesiculosa]